MIPAILALAAKATGGLVGGMGNSDDVSKGMEQYQGLANQGIQTLQAGQQGANAAYSPYQNAGQTGITGATGAITGRQQAQGPTVTQNTPQNAMNYLNPSAAYSMDQANKASTAAAMASGSAGGGMLKALSNNANQMAQTNYNNAYNQMLGSNAQTFGQQQQQYTNNNDFQQQQIGNYMGLAGQGLQAVNNNQQLQAGYNQGINSNYMAQADNQQSGWNKKGQIFDNTSTRFGNDIGGGLANIFGGGK